MLNKKVKSIITTICLCTIIGVGSYATFNSHYSKLINKNDGSSTVILSKDFPLTSYLNEMIEEADIIVIGEYTSFDSTWNMARNPDNLMENDSENYVEGHLFNFNISQLLKGSINKETIKVNHRFSETIKIEDSDAIIAPDGTIQKEATYVNVEEVTNKDPLYIEPMIGENYMLFLKKDDVFGTYYGAIEPFSIKFNEDDLAELQTNIETINEDNLMYDIKIKEKTFTIKNEIHETVNDTISGMNIDQIIQKVKNAVE